MSAELTDFLMGDSLLARRLEATDAACGVECVETLLGLHPNEDIEVARVGGGVATFAGRESPMTQAVGLGMEGAVTAGDIDRLEDFYKSRGAEVRIELCPMADPSLLKLLTSREYRLVDHSQTLVRRLWRGEAFDNQSVNVEIHRTAKSELPSWAMAVAQGFMEQASVPQDIMDLVSDSFYMPSNACFLAKLNGQIVGGGSVSVMDGVATIAGQSTLTTYRKRGVQSALIRAGLRLAVECGCELATAGTLPGSTSQRNFERHGFRVAYTRSKMCRTWRRF